jgi:hypothetical protein
MAIHDRGLTLAVNREGFLVLLPESEERIGLYRIADVSYWKHYTVGSLFVFQGAPAVLLYRDTFFADPIDSPPDPQVFTPVRGASQPRGLRVPAFDTLPQAWEVEGLRFAQDGYWYYRGIRREAPQSVCMRSADLIRPGEAVSLGAWRNAALPEPLDRAPPVLRLALEATFALSGKDRLNVAAIISPDFPTARRFASQTALSSDGEEPVVELHGFYIPGAGALVILPDGRGMVADALGLEEGTARQVSCPPLPEGFVYTAIAPLGDTLVAAWEEQQDWNVGSAGLMLFRPVRDYASKAEAYKR